MTEAEARAFYRSRRWAEVSQSYRRSHPLCAMCQARGVVRRARLVDHVTPIRSGGDPLDEGNMQALCQDCHNAKTKAEQAGRALSGCGVDGLPVDPRHPWRVAQEVSNGSASQVPPGDQGGARPAGSVGNVTVRGGAGEKSGGLRAQTELAVERAVSAIF